MIEVDKRTDLDPGARTHLPTEKKRCDLESKHSILVSRLKAWLDGRFFSATPGDFRQHHIGHCRRSPETELCQTDVIGGIK